MSHGVLRSPFVRGTWFGYGGWGCLDYFVEQPGRYTFAEAFFANHHALIHSIESKSGNQRGLQFDKNVVVLYGDPAWVARWNEDVAAVAARTGAQVVDVGGWVDGRGATLDDRPDGLHLSGPALDAEARWLAEQLR